MPREFLSLTTFFHIIWKFARYIVYFHSHLKKTLNKQINTFLLIDLFVVKQHQCYKKIDEIHFYSKLLTFRHGFNTSDTGIWWQIPYTHLSLMHTLLHTLLLLENIIFPMYDMFCMFKSYTIVGGGCCEMVLMPWPINLCLSRNVKKKIVF